MFPKAEETKRSRQPDMRALLADRRRQMRSLNDKPEHLQGTQRRERFLSSEAAPSSVHIDFLRRPFNLSTQARV